MDLSKTWFLKKSNFLPEKGYKITTATPLKDSVKNLEYDGDDLGVTIDGTTATFKVFAPLASEVNLLLYANWEDAKDDVNNAKAQSVTDDLTNGTRQPMILDEATGVYSIKIDDISGKNYYLYEVVNLGDVFRVADINAKVCAPNSVASQIIDVNDPSLKPTNWSEDYVNPWNGSNTTKQLFMKCT